MKKTKRKNKVTGFEKLIYTLTVILLVSFPFVSVFSKSMLSKVNYEVEDIKEQTEKYSKSNEDLQMKINELASLENLETVAKNMGLSYNYSSVKTID